MQLIFVVNSPISSAKCVAEHTDEDGRNGGDAELLDGPVLHAGVDGNHRHVTLRVEICEYIKATHSRLICVIHVVE